VLNEALNQAVAQAASAEVFGQEDAQLAPVPGGTIVEM